jgi:o-succinylbenzoate---CoA ligase
MENVQCPISEHAKHTPHHVALVEQNRDWTYEELNGCITSVCNDLKKVGVQEHSRVAFVARTSPATIILFFALLRLKAIACPLSFRIPQEQLPKYIELLGASHVLESVELNTGPSGSFTMRLDQLATFLFTSGSSGIPKIVCHSYGNHYYNAMGVIGPLQLDTSSRWLLSLPLFHVSGIAILFRSFLRGSAVVLAEQIDASVIESLQISHLSLVPTQLYRLLQEKAELKCLKCILLGGGPIPSDLLNAARARGLPIVATYSMTEMSSIIALSPATPLLYRKLKIEKDSEIWVGGETLFQGYWDASSETVVHADKQGWFPTKDLGRWTEGHELEIIGRKDRQFISGGENIQPEMIERALSALPGIRQATVLPIDDLEFGKCPVAFLDDETNSYTLERIREALKNELPRFMHPVRIFPYPIESGIKPTLASLKQYLAQVLEPCAKNRE